MGGAGLPVTPEHAIARLFTEPLSSDWFSAPFLRDIPIDDTKRLLAHMSADLGAFLRVTRIGDGLVTESERGKVPTDVRLDADSRFAGLFCHPTGLAPVPVC